MNEPTLNEVLRELGYSTRDAEGIAGALGKKAILDEDGDVVFEGRAGAVWAWLREEGLYPRKGATCS